MKTHTRTHTHTHTHLVTPSHHPPNKTHTQQIEEGFDVNSADYDRRSALHLASVKGFDECVALLLSAGADPNVEDAFQGTPLWEACKHRHANTIKLLVKHGAKYVCGGVLCCVFDDTWWVVMRRGGVDEEGWG